MAVQRILAAVDFSDVTRPVIEFSSQLAHAFGAKLWAIHVEPEEPAFVGYGPGPQNTRNHVADRFREEHRKLEALAQDLRDTGLNATPLQLQGTPADKIKEKAREIAVDVIVIGSHGHGAFYELIAGSVCQAVLKDPPCPVLVVPAGQGHD